MKICYFGTFDLEYTRNKINLKALRDAGVEVIECRSELKSRKKYWDLLKRHAALKGEYDVMIVGFAGHAIMPVAWLAGKLSGKPVILDAFFSMYDAMILDRQAHSKFSFSALKFWVMDWLACALSNRVLLQTNAQIDFFVRTFKLPRKKFIRVTLASDDSIMHPRPAPERVGPLRVHFHGTYLPTQGIPYIIQAAKLLENEPVHFSVVGRLSKYGEALDLAKELQIRNVEFIDILPYDKLAEQIATSDVCLGVFGITERVKRDFAFKIVEALAMKKPLITSDEPPAREVLTDGEEALLVPSADPEAIANAIRRLGADPALRIRLAESGFLVFQRLFSMRALGEQLIAAAGSVLPKK